jgi:hypothetical protein
VKVIDEADLREPRSYSSVAWIRVSGDELRDRGVELRTPASDGTWDEAGPIQEAILETPSGDQPILIWHLGLERRPNETGVHPCAEIRAPVSTTDAKAFVLRALDALDVPHARAEWIVVAEDWPPFK